jgi:hypothetical protein
MSALKKIADWLDPGRAAQAANDTEALDNINATVNDLVKKLASSAATTIVLRKQIKSLRDALFVLRAYTIDALDDAQEALDGLSARSKGRPAAAATVEAVKADLKQIADVLADTGTIGSQPVKVAA